MDAPGVTVTANVGPNVSVDAAIKAQFVTLLATQLKDNICSICGLKLDNPVFLEIHFWEHTGDKMELECLRCGGRFTHQAEFLDHFSRHSPDLIPEPNEPIFKLSKYFEALARDRLILL